jgi:hypothetical protein
MIRLRGLDDGGNQIAFEQGGAGGRYETAADPISKSHFHGLWLLSKVLRSTKC